MSKTGATLNHPQPEQFAVGDIVRYHPIIGEADDGKDYKIWAIDPNLGGSKQAVAWLKGKSGCVSQQALTKVKP